MWVWFGKKFINKFHKHLKVMVYIYLVFAHVKFMQGTIDCVYGIFAWPFTLTWPCISLIICTCITLVKRKTKASSTDVFLLAIVNFSVFFFFFYFCSNRDNKAYGNNEKLLLVFFFLNCTFWELRNHSLSVMRW